MSVTSKSYSSNDPFQWGYALAIALAAATPVDVLTLDGRPMDKLFITIKNTGANPLTGFSVLARAHRELDGTGTPLAPFVTIASIGTDFTAPKGMIVQASGDLTALANGVQGWLVMQLYGPSDIKLNMTSAVGSSVDVHYGIN